MVDTVDTLRKVNYASISKTFWVFLHYNVWTAKQEESFLKSKFDEETLASISSSPC